MQTIFLSHIVKTNMSPKPVLRVVTFHPPALGYVHVAWLCATCPWPGRPVAGNRDPRVLLLELFFSAWSVERWVHEAREGGSEVQGSDTHSLLLALPRGLLIAGRRYVSPVVAVKLWFVLESISFNCTWNCVVLSARWSPYPERAAGHQTVLACNCASLNSLI